MISISEQLRNWRSRYRLSKHEAAIVLGLSVRTLEEVEQGTQLVRGQARAALVDRLSHPPHPQIKGLPPDAGRGPGT